jgi:hypothetical protein
MEYLSTSNGSYLYRNSIIKVEFESISYKILDIEFLTDEKIETKLSRAAEMIYLLNNLNGKSVFKFKDN